MTVSFRPFFLLDGRGAEREGGVEEPKGGSACGERKAGADDFAGFLLIKHGTAIRPSGRVFTCCGALVQSQRGSRATYSWVVEICCVVLTQSREGVRDALEMLLS